MMEPVFDNIETIRFILGDQLNHDHSWYAEKDEHTLYVVAEIFEEATYTRHHVQKVHAFFPRDGSLRHDIKGSRASSALFDT